MYSRILSILFTTCAVASSSAEQIAACSLIADADLISLGGPAGVVRSTEKQPSGVQACKVEVQGLPGGVTMSIVLSQGVPQRALQLRAVQEKILADSKPEELAARGEYYKDRVMCRVSNRSRIETSQCIGSTEQSVVALALVRPQSEAQAAYPAWQLQLIATVLARVMERGG